MNKDELYDAFRSDVVDTARPYLWTDEEVYRYMADAHRMFVRLTGGIADVTSDACTVTMTAGERYAELHPSILRIMTAYRDSDKGDITVINQTDVPSLQESDYGLRTALRMSNTQGQVRYMVIGQQRNKAQLILIPDVDDTAYLSIYRLPLSIVGEDNDEITEVDEEHHIHLLDWMKRMAHRKQDSETFDKGRSEKFEQDFRNYCSFVKAEWERYKHKTRVVAYGGL